MGENRVTISLIKRYISVMLVAALVLTGIQLPTIATAKEVESTEITLKVGQTRTLTTDVPMKVVTVTPETSITPETATVSNAAPVTKEVPSEISWSSDAEKVATVNDEGLVTAVAVGTANVKLSVEGNDYKVWKVTVKAAGNEVTSNKPTVTPDKPTEAPTNVPTNVPTVTPDKPTVTPDKPTEAPDKPTEAPDKPTEAPTKAPTVTEVAKPTAKPAPENYVKVKSVKLDASKITVGTKATFTLTATVNPTNAKYKTITWSSSNKKVATVSKKGKVSAKKVGTAVITASTKDGKKATCKVTVKTGVKVTYNLAKGKNHGLNPTYVAKNVKTKLYAPTKKGYTFKGWYVNNGKKKVTSIKTKKAIKVTAKWQKVTKPGKVTINAKKTKASGKKITVKYAKVKGANGYEVSYSTNKKFAKKKTTTVTTKKTSVTIKNLKKGIYYVKVAAYKTDSTGAKVKGKASKVVTVKIK